MAGWVDPFRRLWGWLSSVPAEPVVENPKVIEVDFHIQRALPTITFEIARTIDLTTER